jgi:hypothetical protein
VSASVSVTSGVGPVAGSSSTFGAFGVNPVERPAKYILTFAATSHTLPANTVVEVSTANPIGVLTAFAFIEAQAKGILTAINTLITDLTETKKVLAQVVSDLRGEGLLQ